MGVLKRTIGLVWVALAVLPAASLLAVPPKVVETVPRNGDLNVDPDLRELRFVFDQDMSTGGYSICGGGPLFPETVGRPRWADSRTLVMRVQLAGDHEYRLSVNCSAAQKCHNIAGESAVPYPVQFRTAASEGMAQPATTGAQDNAQAAARQPPRTEPSMPWTCETPAASRRSPWNSKQAARAALRGGCAGSDSRTQSGSRNISISGTTPPCGGIPISSPPTRRCGSSHATAYS
ncbi:MAG: hypothetical protein QM570_11265 [Planctomycetota bacterium]|nr:hypothetical protein [Planctomycetota bacterium]